MITIRNQMVTQAEHLSPSFWLYVLGWQSENITNSLLKNFPECIPDARYKSIFRFILQSTSTHCLLELPLEVYQPCHQGLCNTCANKQCHLTSTHQSWGLMTHTTKEKTPKMSSWFCHQVYQTDMVKDCSGAWVSLCITQVSALLLTQSDVLKNCLSMC